MCNNIFVCMQYHNVSPYTRSKNSNNHCLYRDTMPLMHKYCRFPGPHVLKALCEHANV